MQWYFFAIPALDPQDAQSELTRYCAGQRVISVDRQFVAAGLDSHWAVCVSVAPGADRLPDARKAPGRRPETSAKVDYKEVLSEADFAVFADLRVWRKSAAEQDGAPVYAVFTNEQLAEIVQRRVTSLEELGKIEGIGPARLERFGAALLTRLHAGAKAAE